MTALFSYRLYTLRKEHKETQGDLAALLNVKRATISAYEKAKIAPPYDKVVALSEHFCVSVDFLLGKSDFRTAPEEQVSENENVDVMEVLRTLKADVKDKNKNCFVNGKKISNNVRNDIVVIVDSIIKILEKTI